MKISFRSDRHFHRARYLPVDGFKALESVLRGPVDVTEDGCEVLNHFTKVLIVVPEE